MSLAETLFDRLLGKVLDDLTGAKVSLHASAVYSSDYKAIIVIARFRNPSARRDKVESWTLRLPDGTTLHPSAAHGTLTVEPLPWAWPPSVAVDGNDSQSWAVFFPGDDQLREQMKAEPIQVEMEVDLLHAGKLTQQMEVNSLATLRRRGGQEPA